MSVVRLLIKRLPNGKGLPMPRAMTDGAAGLDLHAADTRTIEPGQIALVPCGFAMALPPMHEAQVRPRSGLASKNGITLVNSPGTIDADYRGEVKVPLINHGRESFEIDRGMRIAQMVVMPLPRVEVEEVDELNATDRGTGGFGSTG
ncbi:MAG: dUTP diphosphatase [Planctomycetota bacterium]